MIDKILAPLNRGIIFMMVLSIFWLRILNIPFATTSRAISCPLNNSREKPLSPLILSLSLSPLHPGLDLELSEKNFPSKGINGIR